MSGKLITKRGWTYLRNEWYRTKHSERHEFERKRFRNFLFKMCGCYDLVIFWLRVQASWISLRIFREVFGEERIVAGQEETKIKMNRAVEAVRDAVRDAERWVLPVAYESSAAQPARTHPWFAFDSLLLSFKPDACTGGGPYADLKLVVTASSWYRREQTKC